MDLNKYIKNVPDFPKKGIIFKDIAPLLNSPEAFNYVIDEMSKYIADADIIVAPDARGFIFGTPVAYKTKKPFVMVRKAGKLPGNTIKQNYDLEYGNNTLEIQADVIKPGLKAVIVDDILATGGTTKAIIDLLRNQGITVTDLVVLFVIPGLDAESKLGNIKIHSIM
ncbi:adenine phosphoribosyltransferase [Mycoplasmopsis verecunda]|uniref:Adenine phosphoribosyltransferase n=1 Tax=Mycoplasmopsis verecunda TaxID=171291 RepID=A0A1T4KYA2_9BACT|nr:adenine phosphoribosyltransferase [Mycoplasmopsis verecunda]WPB54340.1 adenine phosphoribosyltransferase [Mycoplasmopsis verecunda]SJZ47287.1 adenine phosphoribosyltransferase [Mycoplasmopsis verecunda]